jgi:hypothetical protein
MCADSFIVRGFPTTRTERMGPFNRLMKTVLWTNTFPPVADCSCSFIADEHARALEEQWIDDLDGANSPDTSGSFNYSPNSL